MDPYRVAPGSPAHLDRRDPADSAVFSMTKQEGRQRLKDLNRTLSGLQRKLYAQGKHKLLVVLQAMDTGGKDGTIRHVFHGTNPQGVRVTSFKVPTPTEIAHDYLWRVHHHTPGTGKIQIFNRSHYEDVLVVRVHDLVPKERWAKRYDHINEFERLLADEGTTILKFFLHISKEEQRERLQARLDEPDSQWKFSLGDLDERALWPQYFEAYEEAITRTSTDWAPWYVVPADRKWYRNLVISSVLIATLEGLGVDYPEPAEDFSGVVIPD